MRRTFRFVVAAALMMATVVIGAVPASADVLWTVSKSTVAVGVESEPVVQTSLASDVLWT
ncbi:hypothetical protein Kpho01_13900 [Kitasatospora phosalacinea]|uniref:Uncharacterized protein n=1 Tax=Kitasatospora phosalacinea TaxID=2065 RepID=A0A9W6PCN4_9ACTN|nr:hypothetical protein Kpho01_13900 [Kitasatospora phosalacinea]